MSLRKFIKKYGETVKQSTKAVAALPKGIVHDPKRAFLGVDPLSTGIWNKILGRDDAPLVNQFGGPTKATLNDVGANNWTRGGFKAADLIAGYYGAQGLAGIGGDPATAGGAVSAGDTAAVGGGAGAVGGGAGSWLQYLGPVVGGASNIIAGNKAAKAEEDAAQRAADVTLHMYDQNRADLAPYRQAGYVALGQLGKGLEAGGDFNRDFTLDDFHADPGYEFRQAEGAKTLERSAAARGGLLGGGTLKALTRYGQGVASDEYSSAYSRFNNDRTQRFNRLSALAGTGQTAVNTGVNAGTTAAGQIADTTLAAGNARAANAINTGNAVNNTIGSLGQFYLQNQYLNRGYPARVGG